MSAGCRLPKREMMDVRRLHRRLSSVRACTGLSESGKLGWNFFGKAGNIVLDELEVLEVKAFVPARDFELSKRFYQDLGFTMPSDDAGIAYFHHGECSFLLQDVYEPVHAENFKMHLLVKDVQRWYEHVLGAEIVEKYGVMLSDITHQPWGMIDFVIYDPSGVLWHFSENVEASEDA